MTVDENAELRRGNGVGLEVAGPIVRGIRLGASRPGEILLAAEVAVAGAGELDTLDGLVRVWAELGEPRVATRLACFPPGATLRRRDVTGVTGPELSAIRAELHAERGIGSTVLIEQAARRWLIELDWDETWVRQLEELAERAGFADVAVEPSPLALARALPVTAARVVRDAAGGHGFEYVADDGVPLAAATIERIGAQPPDLVVGSSPVPPTWFEGVVGREGIRRELHRLRTADDADPSAAAPSTAPAAVLIGTETAPIWPRPDLHSPIRQCVAIGAAAAAAGLRGRVHPVDVIAPWRDEEPGDAFDARPWAIERVTELPERDHTGPRGIERWISRLLPRRR